MRIALDATALPSQPGGAGNYILNLGRALMELESPHEIIILTHKADRGLFKLRPNLEAGLYFTSDRGRPHRLIWEQVSLPRLLKKLRIDLLHSPHYTIPLHSSVPVVVTFHDMTFFLYPHFHQFIKRWFFPWMIQQSSQRSAAILTVSESTRRDAIRLLDVLPEKITTTPLGLDPIFKPIKDAAHLQAIQNKYLLPDRFIFHVGTLEPRKNHTILLRAFAEIAGEFPDHHLVLTGSPGWNKNEIGRAILDSPVRDRILVTGYADLQDLPALYSLAELFVYPSVYEGFGLPVLEAMACGTPVITSSVSSMPEIAGNYAMLTEPGDVLSLKNAMRALLDNPEHAKMMAKQAEIRARQFTWQAMAEKTLQVYEKVLHSG